MARPSEEDMSAAVEWLRAFEGDAEMAESLERVAAWLESTVEQILRSKAIRKIMRENPGASWAQASAHLDRVLQGRE